MNLATLTEIPADQLPDCLRRDHLASPYFPGTSRGMLAVVITLCAVFTLTSFNRLNHTDLWGHLDFGRWIIAHQTLPAHDPFAAQPSDTPVLHAAWLAQVIGYEVQRAFGNEGLAFGHALLVTLAAGVLMLAVARRGVGPHFAAIAGAAMFLLDLPIVGTIRPQLFGQLGAALVLLACSELPTRRHPLVWLPMVGALWANLHGSILMGIAILGCFAIGMTWRALCDQSFDTQAVWRDSRVGRSWLAVFLLVAGACVNPHGPLLLSRILFFGEHAALSYISEWKALTPTSLTGVLLIAAVIAAACLWKYGKRKWELHEYLLLALFALATLSAIRMMAWWAVVWPWVVMPHAAAAWKQYLGDRGIAATRHPEYRVPAGCPADEPAAMHTLIAMGCAFAAAIVAPPSYSLVSGRCRGDVPVSVREAPVHLADQVCRLKLDGNVAAPMDWADYLVWTSDGRMKPLIYGHIHLSRPETFEDYRKVFRGDDVWLHVLRNHQIRYLLLSKEQHKTLAGKVLAESRSGLGHVRIVYQDQRGILVDVMPQSSAAPNAAMQGG